MKKLALALALLATQAQAASVMLYMDSRGASGAWDSPPTDVGTLLAAERPDLTVYNRSYPGRPTCDESGWVVKQDLKDKIDQLGPDYVVLMLDVNDVIHCADWTPAAVVGRLRTLAGTIRNKGASEIVLISTPVIDCHGSGPTCGLREWGRDVMEEWYERDNPNYTTGNLRDEFLATDWLSCSSDGVHPTGVACRQIMAEFLAEVIP